MNLSENWRSNIQKSGLASILKFGMVFAALSLVMADCAPTLCVKMVEGAFQAEAFSGLI